MRKLGFLFCVLLLAVALMGPVYAWSEYPAVRSAVKTGILAVGVRTVDYTSNQPVAVLDKKEDTAGILPSPLLPVPGGGAGYLGRGSGCELAAVGHALQPDSKQDAPLLLGSARSDNGASVYGHSGKIYYSDQLLTFTDCSPEFQPEFTFEIGNVGTVPARVLRLNLVDLLGEDEVQAGGWTLTNPKGYEQTGRGLAWLQAAVGDTVLDPGKTMRLRLQFDILGSVPQNSKRLAVDSCPWNSPL